MNYGRLWRADDVSRGSNDAAENNLWRWTFTRLKSLPGRFKGAESSLARAPEDIASCILGSTGPRRVASGLILRKVNWKRGLVRARIIFAARRARTHQLMSSGCAIYVVFALFTKILGGKWEFELLTLVRHFSGEKRPRRPLGQVKIMQIYTMMYFLIPTFRCRDNFHFLIPYYSHHLNQSCRIL